MNESERREADRLRLMQDPDIRQMALDAHHARDLDPDWTNTGYYSDGTPRLEFGLRAAREYKRRGGSLAGLLAGDVATAIFALLAAWDIEDQMRPEPDYYDDPVYAP